MTFREDAILSMAVEDFTEAHVADIDWDNCLVVDD